MATFTATLAEILRCEDPYDADHSLIGLNRYPIWSEDYRKTLNDKIVMRYWNREIGAETVSMFSHNMRRKMSEIMPYYNQLADTAAIEYDPLETLSIHQRTTNTDALRTSGTRDDDTTGRTVDEGGSTVNVNESTLTERDTDEGTHETGSSDTEHSSQTGAETSLSRTTDEATHETGSSNTVAVSDDDSLSSTDTESTRSEDVNTTGQTTTSGTEAVESSTTNTSDGSSRAVNSELPQTRLSGNENYATSAADSQSVSTGDSSNSTDSTTSSDEDTETSSHTTAEQNENSTTTTTTHTEQSTDVDTVSDGTRHEKVGEDTTSTSSTDESTRVDNTTDGTRSETVSQTVDHTSETVGATHNTQDTLGSLASRLSGTENRETIGNNYQQGSQGNKSQMILLFRETILNIDVMILNDLETLFMGIWDNDNSFTELHGSGVNLLDPWGRPYPLGGW